VAGQGTDGTDFEAAWAVEQLATAIRVAAKEERWVKVNGL
jgi:predicted dehydrogenase